MTKYFAIYEYYAENGQLTLRIKDTIEELFEHYINFCQCNDLIDLETNKKCNHNIFNKYYYPFIKCNNCDFDTSQLVYSHNKLKFINNDSDINKCFVGFELKFQNGNKVIYDIFDLNDKIHIDNIKIELHNYKKITKFCL